MEKKMVFLCTDVKFGNQKRYQEWFQRQYLNTPESQTLRSDLIRFIIGCIHPSNEVLCSDIIPRWAVIGWLLSSCTSTVATANSKLSLFYDWLFYNTETDNIMNIEPGILVMYHSLRPHPVLTTSLLDFLCRIIPNFHPSLTEKVKAGVHNSLAQILEKRVVQSLEALFDNPRMDLDLRKLVRDTFPDFCPASAALTDLKHEEFIPPVVSSGSPVTKMDLMAETGLDFGSSIGMNATSSSSSDVELNNNSNHIGDDEAMFSDEDDDDNKLQINLNVKHQPPSLSSTSPSSVTQHQTNNKVKSEDTHSAGLQINSSSTNNNSNNNSTSLLSNSASVGKANNAVVYDSVLSSSTNCLTENNYKILRTTNEMLDREQRTSFNSHLEYLEKDTKNFLEDFLLEKEITDKCCCRVSARSKKADMMEGSLLWEMCNILQKICDLIFSEDLDSEEAQHLAACLSYLLSSDLNYESSLLPSKVTPETLDQSLNRPLYILFENLITLTEDDHRRQSLLLLLSELHKASPAMGYHFLYFLKATMVRREEEDEEEQHSGSGALLQMYRDLCKASGQKDFTGFILKDLHICCERDPRLISWVVPDIYRTFPKQTKGNVDLLQLILERLDSSQSHDLICMVLQGSLQMFDNSSFTNILEKSLQWETLEQNFLWQLARAHEIIVGCCLPVLPKLKFSSHTDSVLSTHGEALSNILMMLRRESPTENLLRPLLLRELRPSDPTVVTILQYWVERYEDKMSVLINDIINSKHHQPSPNKRKRNQASKSSSSSSSSSHSSSVPLDQVLSHLNHLRTACGQTKFFALSTMQEALQTAQSQCSESQKRKYSDLFALIEEDVQSLPPPETQRKTKSNRGRKPKAKKKRDSDSEEESSEEEDIKKPSRKRKKNSQLGSDSD
ncbi:Integrator complex subunit 3-like protein [Armadillidium nasatum]|uniref:SOSS complex subunit A homolog n=1 Tax=Armadillidium nasatum TaxID=96803 RepID=A0A5N5STC7_9CRUS|nr:Integrator complex subunit 3-like protein [Armadillidium nasatum]